MTTWQAAYRDHGPAVLAYLRCRVRREEAEDLLQETFVRAISGQEELSHIERLRPYLLTIAHNLMLNAARRRRTEPLDDDAAEQAAPCDRSDDDRLDLEKLESLLESVVVSLSPAQRQAFELGVLRQEPYREIARRLGWSLAQVKINVFRSRRAAIDRLRQLLAPIPPRRASS